MLTLLLQLCTAVLTCWGIFFTFEEYDEEEDFSVAQQVQEDPYAWPAKQIPTIPQQETQQPIAEQSVVNPTCCATEFTTS